MKYIATILLCLFFISLKAQQRFPTGFPTQFNTGFNKWGYAMSDSGLIVANRDTNWLAKYSGTVVFRPANKKFYYFDSTTLTWNQFGTVIDTTSLSNRINLKLNISDTIGQWLAQTTRLVDTVYRVNDSTVGYTINGDAHTFQILGRLPSGGGGSGTVTSVGLSLPSAFNVTPSTITTSGTFAVTGAGTTAQYIRGNGTLATTDTGMIPTFHLKVRSLFSVTSPLTYNSTTGILGVGDANTSATKGVATFASADFSDNGAGLINLKDVTTAGACINCDITFDAKGRATSFASGTPPQFVNAPGAGDTLSRSDTLKRLNPGYGILHTVNDNNITQRVDTSASGLATQFDLSLVNNGLSRNSDTTQLGGPLTKNTTITGGAFGITINASGAVNPLSISSTGASNALFVNSFSGTGSAINAQSNNATTISAFAFGTGYGGSIGSTSNIGLYAFTTSGVSGLAVDVNPSSTNTSQTILQLKRYTSGTAANNIAGRIEFITEPSSGTVDVTSGYIESGWEDATFATRKSFLALYTTLNGSTTRKANISSAGQWTWDGYPALTAQVDTTTYKPVAIDGSGNVVKMAGWAGSGGGSGINTGNLDTVLALGGRFSANRSVSMAQRIWNLDSANIHLIPVDSVGLSFDLAKAGTMIKFNKPAGAARTYAGSTPFRFIMENTVDDVPGEFNNPVKWGWNINRADSSNYSGMWWSMEPNYRPGGAKFKELIYEVSLPNGVIKNSRLLMSTFVERDTLGNSDNTWDMRGTSFNIYNLENTVGYFSASRGSLSINNTTAANTNFTISNGSDQGQFSLAPGTGILDFNGANFQVSGELNTFIHQGTSSGRAGIRFIGDGGTTGYLIKYGSAYSDATLSNCMQLTAANGAPMETTLTIKPAGTAWIGDITTYFTGTQKVNISGSLALRGNAVATTASYLLGKSSDSTVVELTPASLATLLGVGNTLYTGDGTLGADRNVASGGFTLRLSGANNSDTLMSIVNSGTSSTGLFSLGSLFGIDAQSTNVGLRAFGTVTGLLATGDGSEGAIIKSNTIRGATIQSVPSSTNSVQEVIRIERGSTGGPGANGIGGSADFYNKASDNTSNMSNQIISKWTDATVGTRTSQFSITGVNSASTNTILTIDGDGSFTTIGKRTIGVTTSSAGTLTLGNSESYIFNGTTTTWTLPAVSGTAGRIYYIKNIGSGSITLNADSGSNEIYSSSAVNTVAVTAGSAIILISNGTYFTVN